MSLSAGLINRFWELVEKQSDDKCWNWLGNKGRHGYGRLMYNGISYYSHRLSFEIHKGVIPEGLEMLHLCNNPSCCSPNHLEAGTHIKNVQQMWRQNRGSKPPVHKGASHHKTHLTVADIKLIRDTYDAAPIIGNRKKFGCLKEFERKYNMSKGAIQNIAYRKHWKDV